MKLKTKLNAIILGFTMILSMQSAFAACKLTFATQQKKVATISKKKVAGGKKKIYRKASMRKYSPKELNQIMRTVENGYLQPIITQYFIDNKSEIWLLFLIAHSKR